jgi:hypothetical protein
LGRVVSDDREDDVGCRCDFRQRARTLRADLGGEGVSTRGVNVVDGGHGVTGVFETASHIGSHATDSNEGNALGTHKDSAITRKEKGTRRSRRAAMEDRSARTGSSILQGLIYFSSAA